MLKQSLQAQMSHKSHAAIPLTLPAALIHTHAKKYADRNALIDLQITRRASPPRNYTASRN
jgi:hypothetical protein